MAGQQSRTSSSDSNTVFLFGPQALSFDEDAFQHLRREILQRGEYAWILEAVAELPTDLENFAQSYPALESFARSRISLLRDFRGWFDNGAISPALLNLPNFLISPLVVIKQLIQYAEYQKIWRPSFGKETDLKAITQNNVESLGFCTGFLSALAISCSTDKESFVQYSRVAIRLSMLIGAIVDAQNIPEGSTLSKSLAAIWHSASEKEKLVEVLKQYSDAYISIYYDESRATLTVSSDDAPEIKKQLRSAGVRATDITLSGRFHWDGHSEAADALIKFCESDKGLQFPEASALVIPTRSTVGGQTIDSGSLNEEAIRSILLEPIQWYKTFSKVREERLADSNSTIISLGLERCVPPSMLHQLSPQVVHMIDIDRQAQEAALDHPNDDNHENDIAVVGMALKVAGANDLQDFHKLLCAGESQHQEVPEERFTFDTVHRKQDPQRKWFGNFVDNYDSFDHKFFKKTPREAVSMDPQQRQILQIAYQAVQQSGYFRRENPDKFVGCYLGVCSTDYEDNIACHEPTAYSATGHLRGFIAGKISHYFGWTGPGLTIDSACSSSLVAVHQACRAILGGECNSAVAGGSHIMSSPLWYQNLAGASFLSKTGSCKPFDAAADGYCRGEGVAAVYLKKLSAARADGDQIIGVIAGSAVQQNENCTPIVVPNVPSLSDLFEKVLDKARLKAEQISVVEAHGTGTPIGDPAEFDSIRKVLGGSKRNSTLQLGSVKGLVGHCECTSGIISLVKVLLMIQEGFIPPQASFKNINPAIKMTSADQIQISTKQGSWDAKFRAALINNYGASGSNASMVVTQPYPVPASRLASDSASTTSTSLDQPFWLSGLDDRSLRAYISAFRKYITDKKEAISLPDLAYGLARQSNPTLARSLVFSAKSLDDLQKRLEKEEKSLESATDCADPRPVVFCFGGQISKHVGLDRNVYEHVAVLRKHLDECDSYCISLGVGSIFPDIFKRESINDPVRLQACLFALQYSCARSWMDVGVQPAAVVGHSFGELTSLCISGVLSLGDTIKMIIARASIIRDVWGSDGGAMMAVQGKLETVQEVLKKANGSKDISEQAVIACFNGPTSFTVAGSTAGVDAVAEIISKDSAFSSVKSKKLDVTNAFHSPLVDPLMDQLNEATSQLDVKEPSIFRASCTEEESEQKLAPGYFANHMRMPVFFNQSLHRLAKKFPQCIWLEAGSNSTITKMASAALSNPKENHFQAVNITSDNGWSNLIDVTLSLWKAGLNVTFWAHHHTQASSYATLLLPPYQFEITSHWLELKKPPTTIAAPAEAPQEEKMPDTLTTFVGYQDKSQRCARFRVNTMIPEYEKLMRGHVVAYTAPILPLTVQMDLAAESLKSILKPGSALQPQIQDISNDAPICIDSSVSLWLDLEATNDAGDSWTFKFSSTDPEKPKTSTKYSRGKIMLRAFDDPATDLDFTRFERLTGHARCTEILNDPTPSNIIQGRAIYKTFSEVVNYSPPYQGLQKVVGKGHLSAARVVKEYNPETYLDAYLCDTFCQVIGIYINYMTERESNNLYIARGFEKWVRSPKLDTKIDRPEAYDLLAYHQGSLDTGFVTDLFVFHPETAELLEFVLGFQFVKVAKASLTKLLLRMTRDDASKSAAPSKAEALPVHEAPKEQAKEEAKEEVKEAKEEKPAAEKKSKSKAKPKSKPKAKKPKDDILPQVKAILTELSGVEGEKINEGTVLADIGIDSLMGMELVTEIENKFNCKLPEDDIVEVTDVAGVLKCIRSVVGSSGGDGEEEAEESDDASSEADSLFDGNGDAASTDASSSAGESDTKEAKKDGAEFTVSPSKIFDAFKGTKDLTDQFIEEEGCSDYVEKVLRAENELCIALTLETFEKMGVSIQSAEAGEEIKLFDPRPEHKKLIRNLCDMLDRVAGLIKVDGDKITRTEIAYPTRSSKELLEDPNKSTTAHEGIDQLIYYVGTNLSEVLSGKLDGVKLIFGKAEGRKLVSGMYGDWIMNRPCYRQMEDFLSRLISSLNESDGPLKILEMGAGTGGTTKWLVPMLAALGRPVEYTFTDLSAAFVAQAKKTYAQYPFMKYAVHDIEKEPAADLLDKHHVVVASNAIHATHSLQASVLNVKKALRPNGIVMMLEMVEPLYWVDMIFGLFEGWWFFDDGREHALTPVTRWKSDLQSIGFGYVDWTDGKRPESLVNKVIVAAACDQDVAPQPDFKQVPPYTIQIGSEPGRAEAIDTYVRHHTADFDVPNPAPGTRSDHACVVITGATGSTGAHLVADMARRGNVSTVVCMNRRGRGDNPEERQREALLSRGIELKSDEFAKLEFLETDTAKPLLGLSQEVYDGLVDTVTHIIHNAWPMSIKRPLKGFEGQFTVMRNLINLARDASGKHPENSTVHFELVSSIAVVGMYPPWTGNPSVPEIRMPLNAIMPIGYAEAKYICEQMLDRTLHRYPDRFRACVTRLGQIAGSKTSGYWNTTEHLSFIWKSAQNLKAMPSLEGPMSWTPVDDVAGTLADLVMEDTPHPVYNIDNPVRQPWKDMVPVIADELGIPRDQILPFDEWVELVRNSDLPDKENPAGKLADFLAQDFRRMGCGGLLLETTRACEHSETLSAVGPVSDRVAQGYFNYWKRIGFLSE